MIIELNVETVIPLQKLVPPYRHHEERWHDWPLQQHHLFALSTQSAKHEGRYEQFNCSFIHSIGMCSIRRFLAVLRSFFHSSLLCTFSFHPSQPTILPSSLTPSCHLFLGLPLNLAVPTLVFYSPLAGFSLLAYEVS